MFGRVGKLIRREFFNPTVPLIQFQYRIHTNLPETNDAPQVLEQAEGLIEIGRTVIHFFDCRLIGGWSAVKGGGDEGVNELQAIADVGRRRLIAKSGLIHGPVEKVAGSVAGEHSASAVGSMRCGCQPNDQEACLQIAKVRYGLTVVLIIAKGRSLFACDLLAMGVQARALRAGGDPLIQRMPGEIWRHGSNLCSETSPP